MRNGSFPLRLSQALRRRGRAIFTRAEAMAAAQKMRPEGVHGDQVGHALTRLVREGRAEWLDRGLYRLLPPQPEPKLSFSRTWSNPDADCETVIAATLTRPTFTDVARLCFHFGIARVQNVLEAMATDGDLSPRQAEELRGMLARVREGFRNAARRRAS